MPSPVTVAPEAECRAVIDAARVRVVLDWPNVVSAESPIGELARRAFPLSLVQEELSCPFAGRLVVEPMLPTDCGKFSASCPVCGALIVVDVDVTILVGGTVNVTDDGWGGPR